MTQSARDFVDNPAMRDRLMRRATYASVTVAVVLIAAKLAAWLVTDSVALLASLIDSLLDALASLVNLFAVRQALTPADKEHRFGHGKAEALAGLGQAALIIGSALFLVVESIQRLISPQPVAYGLAGIGVMVFSILLTGVLVLYQRHVIRNTNSLAISADRLHYLSDLLTNLTVLVALAITSLPGFLWVDAVGALIVAAVVLKSAIDIVRGALDHLMDRELADEERERIKDVVRRHPEAAAMHDLRTRQSGNQVFIQFHLELDPEMPLRQAHAIAVEIEREVLVLFPGAEVIIHQDPAGMLEDLPPFAGRTV
ncbi:cation diffusion facilitator family transporter [uncultured Ferrovibrio sp.]|uniref:cation diffusion facilitator family transporter n=1 Tax=uncultured Ferrovibrio sp. TaxID=1576913 RepID=UPI002628E0E3|nr:cation diffusion facilitator family transporter [uncultured Ferrovibrio sp.]